jgi:hypothetical protein
MQGNLSIAGLACVVLLAGCGEVNVRKYLPFGGDPIQERSRTPANATEYQCAAGKRIYVRTLEGGAAVWLILPERELRLERIGTENSIRATARATSRWTSPATWRRSRTATRSPTSTARPASANRHRPPSLKGVTQRQACSRAFSHLSQKPSSPTGPGVPQRRQTDIFCSVGCGLLVFRCPRGIVHRHTPFQLQIALQAAGFAAQSAVSILHSSRVR